MEAQGVLDVVDKLIIPIVGYGIYILRDIRNEFRTLNGRVGRLETWKEDHKELDKEAHGHIVELIDHAPCQQSGR